MLNSGYAQLADALEFVHGRQALSEASRHAALCEQFGDTLTAKRWHETIAQMRRVNIETTHHNAVQF